MGFFSRTNFLIIVTSIFFAVSCDQREETDSYEEFPEVDEIVEEGLSESLYSGAVVLIGNDEEVLYQKAFGYATLYDEDLFVVDKPDSMTTSHLFDIASLTKIFGTTYGIMALHSDGRINLDDPVSDYIGEFVTGSHSDITIRHLLSHSSGLLQWYPTYYVLSDPEEFIPWVVDQPLIGIPGETRRYSDLGFMVLAEIIERESGESLSGYLNNRLYERLGLSRIGFSPGSAMSDQIVFTSHGNPFEKKMVYDDEFGYQIDIDPELWDEWREYSLRGEVNDGNAFYTFNGMAGHAGFFAKAEDLARLLQLVLNDGNWDDNRLISSETIDEFISVDEFGNGLGWAMDPGFLNAEELPPGSVGHTGFTGTNFVLSPNDNLYYIFLTNRQHVGVNEDGNYPNLRDIRSELSKVVFH
jgi:serine-type D-Ala-D-Ala carboxypeptidase